MLCKLSTLLPPGPHFHHAHHVHNANQPCQKLFNRFFPAKCPRTGSPPHRSTKKVTFSHIFYNTFLSCQMAINIRKSHGDSNLLKHFLKMSFESKLLFLLPLWISLKVEDPCSSVSAELWRCLGGNPLWRVYIFRVNAEESSFNVMWKCVIQCFKRGVKFY